MSSNFVAAPDAVVSVLVLGSTLRSTIAATPDAVISVKVLGSTKPSLANGNCGVHGN
jgi:hypothetical protein